MSPGTWRSIRSRVSSRAALRTARASSTSLAHAGPVTAAPPRPPFAGLPRTDPPSAMNRSAGSRSVWPNSTCPGTWIPARHEQPVDPIVLSSASRSDTASSSADSWRQTRVDAPPPADLEEPRLELDQFRVELIGGLGPHVEVEPFKAARPTSSSRAAPAAGGAHSQARSSASRRAVRPTPGRHRRCASPRPAPASRGARSRCGRPRRARPGSGLTPPAAGAGKELEVEVLEVLDHHVDVELAPPPLPATRAHPARPLRGLRAARAIASPRPAASGAPPAARERRGRSGLASRRRRVATTGRPASMYSIIGQRAALGVGAEQTATSLAASRSGTSERSPSSIDRVLHAEPSISASYTGRSAPSPTIKTFRPGKPGAIRAAPSIRLSIAFG